ncbi:MAG: CHAT domain-containing protein, partial [bacterium]|nr:CHAT domain-containing protein [bacterium]
MEAPIRVLLVSPRPEDDSAAYIDHRVSARPLVAALDPLGELVELSLLRPPTFKALDDELTRARRAGESYHVVHFDGHGIYDKKLGLGALCFEDPGDEKKLTERRTAIAQADALAGVMRDHRVPLVFLEACQTGMSEVDPKASVAGRLLDRGVASVVAMSHSVLVETARRFVGAFYKSLMTGERV